MQFQKWPKINFWTWKKFKTARNSISRKKLIFIHYVLHFLFFFYSRDKWSSSNLQFFYIPFLFFYTTFSFFYTMFFYFSTLLLSFYSQVLWNSDWMQVQSMGDLAVLSFSINKKRFAIFQQSSNFAVGQIRTRIAGFRSERSTTELFGRWHQVRFHGSLYM